VTRLLAAIALAGSAALGASAAARPAPSQAAACFPFESLPANLRGRAETLLLKALDGEALYTISSDLKPMSSGIASLQIDVAKPDLTEPDALRSILAAWTCGGELRAAVHPFAAVYEGKRPLDAVVFNLPRLRQLLSSKAGFFAPYGLSPASDPIEALMAIEHDPTSARLRGYGYLFGYPDYAVDFFVSASDSQKATGTFVERDFISLPTVLGERHFVYAAPKGHQPNTADTALRAAAEIVFQDYTARRARHIKDGSPSGVLALVREWFDDGRGDVRPSNATRRRILLR
jgi:hypothetical protein